MQCDERHRAEGREVKGEGREAVMRLRMEWKCCMRRRVVTRSDGGQWADRRQIYAYCARQRGGAVQ